MTARQQRIIISIDLDFFYGQVEQLLNPSIRGLPFAVSQKHIVVTCSYAARALGVKKLQSLVDAKRCCRDLIVINGEDLTKYRMASTRIRGLVRQICGPKVEKLGMDELFVDLTDHIAQHLKEQSGMSLQGKRAFRDAISHEPMFEYDCRTVVGHIEPAIENTPIIDDSRLQIGSYFAAYIRNEISNTLGFTCSAGIAHSKIMAKLLADLHKPAMQTVFNTAASPVDLQHWYDTIKVEKLMGFGYRTGRILRWKLLGEPLPDKQAYGDSDKVNGLYFLNDEGEGDEDEFGDEKAMSLTDADRNRRPMARGLTVGDVRTKCSKSDFIEWFGMRRGNILWDLLWGEDPSDVVPTPDFPRQISVEDSWMENRTFESVATGVLRLTESLFRRLELELLSSERVWLRYPQTIRLSVRPGPQKARLSKSTRIPSEVFDLSLPLQQRAQIVVDSQLKNLIREIIGRLDAGWNCNVVNVGVTDFAVNKPSQSLRSLLNNGSSKSQAADLIDWDVFEALPPDVQQDLIEQGLVPTQPLPDDEDDIDFEGDERMFEDGNYKCDKCGLTLYDWMVDAHNAFHSTA